VSILGGAFLKNEARGAFSYCMLLIGGEKESLDQKNSYACASVAGGG